MHYNESKIIPGRYYILDDDNNLIISGEGWETEADATKAAIKATLEDISLDIVWVMYCEMQERPELVICHSIERKDNDSNG
jgi:hypothetical protein